MLTIIQAQLDLYKETQRKRTWRLCGLLYFLGFTGTSTKREQQAQQVTSILNDTDTQEDFIQQFKDLSAQIQAEHLKYSFFGRLGLTKSHLVGHLDAMLDIAVEEKALDKTTVDEIVPSVVFGKVA